MKYLALALLLCTQLHLLHGACYFSEVKPGTTECEDHVDHTMHPIGSSWRNSACMDCTCTGCCDAYERPVNFPDDCTREFDQKNCKYKVFKKADPSVPCEYYGAVGK